MCLLLIHKRTPSIAVIRSLDATAKACSAGHGTASLSSVSPIDAAKLPVVGGSCTLGTQDIQRMVTLGLETGWGLGL